VVVGKETGKLVTLRKTDSCEPVWTEKVVRVRTSDWCTEKQYCPGPVITKRCKDDRLLDFDPCTSHYCPGMTVCCKMQ
jgi:hypothetical protein